MIAEGYEHSSCVTRQDIDGIDNGYETAPILRLNPMVIVLTCWHFILLLADARRLVIKLPKSRGKETSVEVVLADIGQIGTIPAAHLVVNLGHTSPHFHLYRVALFHRESAILSAGDKQKSRKKNCRNAHPCHYSNIHDSVRF